MLRSLDAGRKTGLGWRVLRGAGGLLLVAKGLARVPVSRHLLLLGGAALVYGAVTNRPLRSRPRAATPVPPNAGRAAVPARDAGAAQDAGAQRTKPPGAVRPTERLDIVDQASWESFPASDPPSFAGGR